MKTEQQMNELGFKVIKYQGGYIIEAYIGSDTDIVIPYGVIAIGPCAFYNKDLTSVVLPASLVEIYGFSFAFNKLTKLKLKKGTIIGYRAFYDNPIQEVITDDKTYKGDEIDIELIKENIQ